MAPHIMATVNTAASNSIDGSAVTSMSFSYTISGNANRVLVVGVGLQHSTDPTVSSVTYNSVTMTEAVSISNSGGAAKNRSALYYLLESSLPSSGSYTVQINTTGMYNVVSGFAYDISDMQQIAPVFTDSNAATSSADPSYNFSGSAPDGSVCITCLSHNDAEPTLTVDAIGHQTAHVTDDNDHGGAAKEQRMYSGYLVLDTGVTIDAWDSGGNGEELARTMIALQKYGSPWYAYAHR